MIITEKEIQSWCSPKMYKKAKDSLKQAKIEIYSVKETYFSLKQETGFEISGRIQLPKERVATNCRISLTPTGLEESLCYYPGHWDYHEPKLCIHSATILLSLLDFFKEHPLKLTHPFIEDAINHISLNQIDMQKTVHIEPIININDYQMLSEFKIGNNKKYIIKNLTQFIERFDSHEEYEYGKELTFFHYEKDIAKEDLPLFYLIRQVVKEVPSYNKRNYYDFVEVGKGLNLNYQTLDYFFTLYNGKEVPCKQKDIKSIQFIDGNPNISMTLEKKDYSGETVIDLKMSNLLFFEGNQYAYILENNRLYRSSTEFYQEIFPFFKDLADIDGSVRIEADDMKRFYAKVYPLLSKYANIKTIDFNIEEYAPPQTKFEFYLDYLEPYITLQPFILYGEQRFILGFDNITGYRDELLENNVIRIINEYCYAMPNEKMLFVPNDEEKMYEFLKNGTTRLEALGDVFISDRLKNIHLHYSPKISVGVRLESNLLKIDIDTEGLNINELQDILKSYKTKKKYHRLKDGQFLSLENNSIQTLAQMAEDLNVKELAKGAVDIPAFRAIYLDKLLSEDENIQYNRDQHIRSLLRDFKTIEDSDFEIPNAFENILRPYQKLGYQWLKTLDHYHFGGILADDMGLGKTLQMIVFLYDYSLKEHKAPSLIITPASLVYNWEEEFSRFAPSIKVKVLAGALKERKAILENYQDYDVIITSYDLLKRDIGLYEQKQFAYEIIDEAQYIKNSNTMQAKAVKAILSQGRFALTGTPIENRLSELWSIFDFLMPGFLYPYKTFKNEFETEIVKYKNEELTQRLQKMISPFILRRLKKDVLKDLPDKIEKISIASLEGEQKKLYETYAANVKMRLGSQNEQDFNKSKIQVLSDLMRLRQLCCDPSLVYENYTGGSSKLEQCMELVENCIAANHKILLFSQFTSMLDILKEELDKRNISSYTIKGETGKEKRMQYVNAFNQDDTPVFLISLKAGGTGLNLVGADIVIHYDPWWNIAAQNQATDRAHRIGQKNVVTVYQMITKGTIEEKIVQLQKSKQELVDQVLTGDSTSLTSMSKEDLLEILS